MPKGNNSMMHPLMKSVLHGSNVPCRWSHTIIKHFNWSEQHSVHSFCWHPNCGRLHLWCWEVLPSGQPQNVTVSSGEQKNYHYAWQANI